MSAPDIVGLGSANIDVVLRLRDMPRWENPHVLRGFTLADGGPAGTACVVASVLGEGTGVIDTFGHDEIAAIKRSKLEEAGVDLSHAVLREAPENHITIRGIETNARSVAECAALAQDAGLVPIVEPEVEMKGEHDIEGQFEVTEWFLHRVFEALYEHRVMLEGIVLKTNMVVAGSNCLTQANAETVTAETVKCFRRILPPAVAGVGFLSGGQSDVDATAHLNAMNALGPEPWALSFSYGRAIGRAAMLAWDGKRDDSTGQVALHHRARMNGLASLGQWSPDLEKSELVASRSQVE